MIALRLKGTPAQVMEGIQREVDEDEFQTYDKRRSEAEDGLRDY